MIRKTPVAASLAFFVVTSQAAEPLQIKVYNADSNSFHANSVLISGATEAIVIDAGFTRADAYRIAANVLDSGKTLKTILISNADPDYYFGAATLKAVFPQAEVLATLAVLEKIKAKLPAKVAFWGPKMGLNAPINAVLPQVLHGNTLSVDGQLIEVRGTTGELAHRPYVWVPSQRAIVGNVAVFGNLHVWTADTQKDSERRAWIAQLDEMAALKPALVVPGHMLPGTRLDLGNIEFTRAYLVRFDEMAKQASNAGQLINEMKQAYPEAGLGVALEIGAKVSKGEMKW